MMKFLLFGILLLGMVGCSVKPIAATYCTETGIPAFGDHPCVGWIDARHRAVSPTYYPGFEHQALLFVNGSGNIDYLLIGTE